MLKSRQGKLGLAAVAAVALAAAGAAFAATRMHGSTPSARDGFGPPGMAGSYGRGPFGGPGGGLGGRRGLGLAGGLQAAATYLGLSETQLFDELRSGKTLAQIAASTSGKSTSGLIDVLVKAQQDELAQAVKDGRITQAQADRIGASLEARITAMVNGSFGGGPRFHDGDGPPGLAPRGGGTSPSTPPTHI
jgi:hypothetical protein